MLDGSTYSRLDRVMHGLAFRHRSVQKVLSEIEASAFGQLWQDVPVERPVFITSLPRAGTTLLLQLLARLPSVATHTYRDMPFIMAPVLWNRISRSFHAHDQEVERAHGDGMTVSVDSPEAFEEVLWLSHFPQNYGEAGILVWNEISFEFQREFTDHMRRIIHLRTAGRGPGARYVSKNNANIARIDILKAMFPDSTIMVPLRHPLAQARSMLRQHERFSALHDGDKFSMRYMADIGHFEFGKPHRPIMFSGVDALLEESHKPDRIEYWLGYWTKAFRHLAASSNVTFLDYEGFCSDSCNFRALCEMLELEAAQDLLEQTSRQIRPQAAIEFPEPRPENLDEALEVFEEIRPQCKFALA